MNGTLRATRVPYEDDNPLFEESMGMLDEYAGSYPVSGKHKVCRLDVRCALEDPGCPVSRPAALTI